jgi:hypothetical protein
MGCVCAILTELTFRIADKGAFWDMFLQIAINKAEECLLPKDFPETNSGAMVCPPRLLRKIIENVDDTFVVVQCLQKWFGEENKEKDDKGKPNTEIQALILYLSKKTVDFSSICDEGQPFALQFQKITTS